MAGKLKVFANLAISLDGKIADARHPSLPLGTAADRALMKEIRSQADVVVMGAQTVRVLNRAIVARGRCGRLLANAVVSQSGCLNSKSEFWMNPKVIRFLFTTKKNFSQGVKSAQDRSFVVASGDELKGRDILETLQKAGFQRILLEGGGKLIGMFLQEGLIDELYLTLSPKILGGNENPTLVSTPDTLSPWAELGLISQKKKGNEIFLHYRFLRRRKS